MSFFMPRSKKAFQTELGEQVRVLGRNSLQLAGAAHRTGRVVHWKRGALGVFVQCYSGWVWHTGNTQNTGFLARRIQSKAKICLEFVQVANSLREFSK